MASLCLGKQASIQLSTKAGASYAWRLLFTGEVVSSYWVYLVHTKVPYQKLAVPRLPPGRPNIKALKPLCLSLNRAQRVLV